MHEHEVCGNKEVGTVVSRRMQVLTRMVNVSIAGACRESTELSGALISNVLRRPQRRARPCLSHASTRTQRQTTRRGAGLGSDMLKLERVFDLRVEVPQRVRDSPRPLSGLHFAFPVAQDIYGTRLAPRAFISFPPS